MAWNRSNQADFLRSFHLSLVGTGGAENIRAWLTYYADEESREYWRHDFPEEDIPAHQNPPYDRDRHLPAPSC